MAGREDTFNKKTIIAIVTIIVLLLVASISVGVFLADKGKTEAAESSQTAEKIDNDKKEDNGNSEDQSVQNSDNQARESQEQNTDGNNEQTQNSDNQTANDENNNTTNNTANNTSNSVATSNNQTTRNNTTNNKTNNNTTSTSSTQTPASTGKSNNGATTGTNINEVGETTITRVEEGEEKVVAKKFWDWWNPMSVVVASTTANINAEKPNISVEKSATTKAGENLVYAGEQIKYTINVTNNGKKDVENIEVTDKIPANTTFASINNDGETITSENNIVGVKWIVSVPAGETVTVEFTVTVNPTMLDENGETVETKGIINNKAIANGEESNEVKTAIIKSQKTSAILRDMEQVEKAKIGDTIIYYISVENTGDISGKTTITDYVPAGTELLETPREASVTTDEKGTKIEWKDIDVQANGTKTVFFMVRVTDIDGIIRNVATVGGKDTNEEDVGTADIEITKNVTDIKRDGKSIGKDAKVQAGDVIEYELIVTNKGSEKLTNVVVTDELAGIELTDGSWNVGDLASKESKTIKATYTVQYEKDINGNAEKTITNYAVVTGTSVPVIPEETPEEVSDDDDVTTPVEDTPKLEIDKLSTAVNGNPIAEGKTKVRAGDVIEYTIIVKNTGNVKLTNVVITENNTVKVGNETFTVNEETGNVVIKTIPSLAVGETAEAIKAYYTVTEDDVKEAGTIYNLATAKPEETTPVEDDDDNVVVNEDTSVTAKKIWEDNNNQDGIRPDTIELTLYADGTEYKDEKTNQTVKVTVIPEQKADNEWSYTFEKLPTYNKDGAKITYTVVETSIGDKYTTTYSEDGLTVTNSHTPATTSITVNKYWDDNDDQDGIRPENVTLILKANGTEVGRATVGENENWSKTFDNLPVNANGEEIEYTVDEETVTEGYGKTVDGMTVTNSHTPATTSITVNKYWDDNDDQDGIRPESITVKLLANGEQAKDADGNDLVATITPDANGNWTYTWSGLDKYKAGEKITYTVEENAVENYNTPSEPITLKEAENGYIGTITNTHEIEKTSVTVNKDWQDKDNQDGKRPESITVKLLANGEQAKDADGNDLVATITPDANGNWTYTWSGLDKYKAGEKITYTVEENAVENYNTPSEPITLKEAENGYIGTITNTHEVEKTSVTVNKDWQDGSNQDGIRPDSVSITLNATVENSDGEEESITLPNTVESTITLNEGNSWTYTWSGLDKYKNGQEIKYTVAENNVDERYTVSIKSNNQTTANGYAYTVTNSYTPATIDIPVTKVWNDNDYTEARKTITVELWADGSKTGKTIEIISANGWKGTFKGLPRYKAGEEITYTIKEKAVDRYVTESITGDSTNGFTITNKYQNVIVNKNVVKSVMNEEKFKSKLDFVFVLDTSSSMQGEKAKTMINALNSTMATILENENNRVGVVGYSDDWYEEKGDNATTLLELDHYTANSDNEFIKLAGSGDYTYIQANAINSQGNSENAYRYVRGATYTQIGIRDGANLLINESDREGRIPVIILLTDGDPTRYTTEYNNVKQYNRGDGKANSITAAGAYYTIMSARHYKNAVNDKYKTTENPNIAKFFTIGIDMDKDDIYENTLLNPNKDNVESCKDSDSRSKTRGIYNLMKDNYYKNGGKGSFTGENLNFYSYSDGAFIGNMNEEKLKNILKKTMESIYTYEKETTRTTNIDVDTAVIELEHLDAEKKIEIKINGETTEYTVQELIDSKVVTQTGSKYYMDLNADMFKNKQTIEITYYQVSLLNK